MNTSSRLMNNYVFSGSSDTPSNSSPCVDDILVDSQCPRITGSIDRHDGDAATLFVSEVGGDARSVRQCDAPNDHHLHSFNHMMDDDGESVHGERAFYTSASSSSSSPITTTTDGSGLSFTRRTNDEHHTCDDDDLSASDTGLSCCVILSPPTNDDPLSASDDQFDDLIPSINDLPCELLHAIFLKLDTRTYCVAQQVCKTWRETALSCWLKRSKSMWCQILFLSKRSLSVTKAIYNSQLVHRFERRVKFLFDTLNDIESHARQRVQWHSHLNVEAYFEMAGALRKQLRKTLKITRAILNCSARLTVNFDMLDLSLRRYFKQVEHMFPISVPPTPQEIEQQRQQLAKQHNDLIDSSLGSSYSVDTGLCRELSRKVVRTSRSRLSSQQPAPKRHSRNMFFSSESSLHAGDELKLGNAYYRSPEHDHAFSLAASSSSNALQRSVSDSTSNTSTTITKPPSAPANLSKRHMMRRSSLSFDESSARHVVEFQESNSTTTTSATHRRRERRRRRQHNNNNNNNINNNDMKNLSTTNNNMKNPSTNNNMKNLSTTNNNMTNPSTNNNNMKKPPTNSYELIIATSMSEFSSIGSASTPELPPVNSSSSLSHYTTAKGKSMLVLPQQPFSLSQMNNSDANISPKRGHLARRSDGSMYGSCSTGVKRTKSSTDGVSSTNSENVPTNPFSSRDALASSLKQRNVVKFPSSLIEDDQARCIWDKYVGAKKYHVDCEWFYEHVILQIFPQAANQEKFKDVFKFFVNFPRDNQLTTYKWNVVVSQFGPIPSFYQNFLRFACGDGFLGLINSVKAEEELADQVGFYLLRFSRKEPAKLTLSYCQYSSRTRKPTVYHRRKPNTMPLEQFLERALRFRTTPFKPVPKAFDINATTEVDGFDSFVQTEGYFIASSLTQKKKQRDSTNTGRSPPSALVRSRSLHNPITSAKHQRFKPSCQYQHFNHHHHQPHHVPKLLD